ncbi:hypothetical protein [Pseudomonas sp. TE21394]
MLLTKSCHSEDNISRRKTLKLATLEHYRKTEIEQIADADEGRLFFDIDIESPITVDKKWFNTLFQRQIGFGDDGCEAVHFPGIFEAKVNKQFKFSSKSASHAIIEHGQISIQRQAVSSLVFCMSESAEPGDCRGIFPDYDDEWSINRENLGNFIVELVDCIYERLLDPNEKHVIPKEIDPKEIEIHMDNMSVFYADRKISITKDNMLDINSLMSHMAHTAFIKPTRFKKEREYRLNFVLVHKGINIDPLLDTVIVKASDKLMEYVI